MQQLLYHTSFEPNEVTNLTSIDRNKSQKASASSRYQQHRQKRRRQQRHQAPSTHPPHHQQKTRQPKNHQHQLQHDRNSNAATLRYSRKPNQSNFRENTRCKIYKVDCTRIHCNSRSIGNIHVAPKKYPKRFVCVAGMCRLSKPTVDSLRPNGTQSIHVFANAAASAVAAYACLCTHY